VTIFGVPVPDTSLGRLHEVGIAQEYIMKGDVIYNISWKKGERIKFLPPPKPPRPR